MHDSGRQFERLQSVWGFAAALALSALGCVSTTTSAPTVNPTAYNEANKPTAAQCDLYRAQANLCPKGLGHCSDEDRSKCSAWEDLVAEHCDG